VYKNKHICYEEKNIVYKDDTMSEFAPPPEYVAPTRDAWKLFRIVSEFVEGFDALADLGPSISIFGSSRINKHSPHYKIAVELATKIVQKGFAVITGAGPGVMEAANKGAQEGRGQSCGLIIDLPFESEPNPFLDAKLKIRFRYFFIRKVMFVRYAQGFVFLPGGYGTMDELFEILTLIQTKKMTPIPIYLVGSQFWSGLLGWMKDTLLKENCISPEDFDLFVVTDDLDEVANGLAASYHDKMKLQGLSIK
jgi:uncharacterized protein (TIGR00730 family)